MGFVFCVLLRNIEVWGMPTAADAAIAIGTVILFLCCTKLRKRLFVLRRQVSHTTRGGAVGCPDTSVEPALYLRTWVLGYHKGAVELTHQHPAFLNIS